MGSFINEAATRMEHYDRLTAWACINAILAYCDQGPALFGEFRDITDGATSIDPVQKAKAIMAQRERVAKAA